MDKRKRKRIAFAALIKLVNQGKIKPEHRVVVISTAHGLKFTGFKVDYHEKTLKNVASDHANPPVKLPADVNAVKDCLSRRLK